MKGFITTTVFYFLAIICSAQYKTYADSLKTFIDDYIKEHGVVKGDDKKNLKFFQVNEKFRFYVRFERTENSPWFMMETSGPLKKTYRVYGKAHFKLNDTSVTLCIYQSQDLMKTNEYKDYLLIAFMDATTGEETYESGRYIDLKTADIKNNMLTIDFNKAYNPYCAYADGFNCPVPPVENRMKITILAGEMKYQKKEN